MKFTIPEIAELHLLVDTHTMQQELDLPKAVFVKLNFILKKLEQAEKRATVMQLETIQPDLDSTSYLQIADVLSKTHSQLKPKIKQAIIEHKAAEYFSAEY